MSVPQYSDRPTTPFLTELSSKGFTSYLTFDFSDERAFFKALALGIVAHYNMNYTLLAHYINTIWRPKVADLVGVEEKYVQSMQKSRFDHPDYWRDIGLACTNLSVQHFKNVGKAEQADLVRRGRCPDIGNTLAYQALSMYFSLCIVWYENTQHGITTHSFYNNRTKNEVSLFVHIAHDGNYLYYLYHNEFRYDQPVNKPGFPYYMLYQVTSGPMILGLEVGSDSAANVAGGNSEEGLTKALMDVIEAQAVLIVSESQAVKPESASALSQVKEKTKVANGIIQACKMQRRLESDAVKRVLGLEVYRASEQVQHTIINCTQFPQFGELVTFHAHSFHKSCLAAYLDTQGFQYPAKPGCPICGVELPDTALDVHPALRALFDQKRQETMNQLHPEVYSQSDASGTQGNQSGNLGSAAMTLPKPSVPLFRCISCSKNYPGDYFVSHGCYLCIYCARQAYWFNNGQCIVCNGQFNQQDIDSIAYVDQQLRANGQV